MLTLSGAPSTTLDYYILSIFHYLGSPLSYHMLIFDLMSSRNMYLYNAYIYTYILLLLYQVINHMIVVILCCIFSKIKCLFTDIPNHKFYINECK